MLLSWQLSSSYMCTCASDEHIYCILSMWFVVIIWGSFIVCCVYLCISLSLSLWRELWLVCISIFFLPKWCKDGILCAIQHMHGSRSRGYISIRAEIGGSAVEQHCVTTDSWWWLQNCLGTVHVAYWLHILHATSMVSHCLHRYMSVPTHQCST